MGERLFYVEEKNGCILASNMTLTNALLFIEAYINKYYMEYVDLTISEHKKRREDEQE